MKRITKMELAEIRKTVEKEFPGDPALQQVHIARRIIAKEAAHAGLSVAEYVKLLARKLWHGRVAAERHVSR